MKDILLENDDLQILNGDFFVGDSQNQSVELLLKSMQGEWKEYPEAGCGLLKTQNGVIDRFFQRNISVQLEADGFIIEKLTINEKGIELKGNYEKV